MSAHYDEVLCPPMQAQTCIVGNVLLLKKVKKRHPAEVKTDPFDSIQSMPRTAIAEMAGRVRFDDLVIALAGAGEKVRMAVYSAMPPSLRNIAAVLVEKIGSSPIPPENVKKSRQAVIDAFLG